MSRKRTDFDLTSWRTWLNVLFYEGSRAREAGDWELAIRKFHEILEIDPDDYLSRIALADCYAARGQPNDAIAAYRQVLAHHPALNVVKLKMLALRWERVGECVRCGACCRKMLLTHLNRRIATADELAQIQAAGGGHDNWRFDGNGPDGKALFTCRHIGPDNLCPIHSRRPQLCRDYPTPLVRSRLRPGCGYSFIKRTAAAQQDQDNANTLPERIDNKDM